MSEMRKAVAEYIKPGGSVYLVGIGGVSMCALADFLKKAGLVVSGSDIRENEAILRLRSEGIRVFIGHRAEQIRGMDCVIRTAAALDDNPEVVEAGRIGIPVFERAEAWGAIMKNFEQALCIAGTHGKTTTTSMAVQIAMEAMRDPTAMIGGVLPLIGAEHRIGDNRLIIAESCEYKNSFLKFSPTVAVILNVDADHLDFFHGIGEIVDSFRAFAARTPEDGVVIVNADDPNAMESVRGLDRKIVTFGIAAGQVRAENLESIQGSYAFDIAHPGGLIPIRLNVPGRFNVYNALAAAAAALELGIDGISIARGLEAFGGAKRRFEYKGSWNGAVVYDDYAHHPSEVKALFDMAGQLGYKRTVVVFQPHTYTRTSALFEDFVRELSRPDLVLLLPIYSAREVDTGEVSSAMLAAAIGERSVLVADIPGAAEQLRHIARKGDLILTVGAGEAYRAGELLVKTGV